MGGLEACLMGRAWQGLFIFICFVQSVLAGLSSPFESTVEGLTIPNAHWVDREKGHILRSMEPRIQMDAPVDRYFQEFLALGLSHVLIFKTDEKGEVAREVQAFVKAGIRPSHIYQIPFKWKDIEDFRLACQQTIQALSLLKDIESREGERILMHCTVGEDRTGFLDGVYHFAKDPNQPLLPLFQERMCEKGYGAGNPQKPFHRVVGPIRESLTPFFMKMIFLLKTQRLKYEDLNYEVCNKDPKAFKSFQKWSVPLDLRCKASSQYKP